MTNQHTRLEALLTELCGQPVTVALWGNGKLVAEISGTGSFWCRDDAQRDGWAARLFLVCESLLATEEDDGEVAEKFWKEGVEHLRALYARPAAVKRDLG